MVRSLHCLGSGGKGVGVRVLVGVGVGVRVLVGVFVGVLVGVGSLTSKH